MDNNFRRPRESGDPATSGRTPLDSRLRGNDATNLTPLGRILGQPRRTLAVAIVASLAAHLIVASLPQPPMSAPEPMPMLSATITEMPPPPAPPVKRPHVKPKPKPAPAPVVATPAPEPVVES